MSRLLAILISIEIQEGGEAIYFLSNLLLVIWGCFGLFKKNIYFVTGTMFLSVQTVTYLKVCEMCAHSAKAHFRGQALVLGEKVFLTLNISVHPKGVWLGIGQNSVPATWSPQYQTCETMSLWASVILEQERNFLKLLPQIWKQQNVFALCSVTLTFTQINGLVQTLKNSPILFCLLH